MLHESDETARPVDENGSIPATGDDDWMNSADVQAAAFAGLAENPSIPEGERARLREHAAKLAEHAADPDEHKPAAGAFAELLDRVKEMRASVQSETGRAAMLVAVLDLINPIDVDYPSDTTDAEIDEQATGVARFLTSLTASLLGYIESGTLPYQIAKD